MHPHASAIIVAGGMGKRLSSPEPKGFVLLGGMPLFSYALRVFDTHESIDELVIVIPAGYRERVDAVLVGLSLGKVIAIVEGGEHRWQSVLNGLKACQSASPWVLVHDAARPFVTHAVIDALLKMAGPYECAVTATPEVDTIRRVEGDRALETVDRSTLVRVGTPQMFVKDKLVAGFELAAAMESPPTDEGVLMERLGVAVGIAQGDPMNFKITTAQDLHMAEALVRNN